MHQILIRAWLMKRTPVILKLKVNAICATPLLSPTKVMNQTSGDPSAPERAPNSSWIEQWAEPFRPSIQEFLPLEIISPSSRDWASTPFCPKINATWRKRRRRRRRLQSLLMCNRGFFSSIPPPFLNMRFLIVALNSPKFPFSRGIVFPPCHI